MEDNAKRHRGRPSKGPRHTFTVKLDLERAAKLTEILRTLNITGIGYLTPIIEAHIDAIDLHQLRKPSGEGQMAVAKDSTTPNLRSTVQHSPTTYEALRRAETLARKINLLLHTRMDESGLPYRYQTIRDGSKKTGYYSSRTRWSMIKNGKFQVVPDACLRAIATVFDVNPEYLLHGDAELPAEVEVMLPQVRIKRLSEVRDFAVKALGPVDPEGLRAITKVLDHAIQL